MNKPLPEVPKSDKNYPLGEVKKGRLLTWHPSGGRFDCPYCGRENPIDGGHSGAVGFRIAGWSKHLFHCYEKTLLRHGWKIGRYYNSPPFGHKLERLLPQDVRGLAKQLRVSLKDIPVEPTAETYMPCAADVRDPNGETSGCLNKPRGGSAYCHLHQPKGNKP